MAKLLSQTFPALATRDETHGQLCFEASQIRRHLPYMAAHLTHQVFFFQRIITKVPAEDDDSRNPDNDIRNSANPQH